jgi:AcrR family transcriptional regulator
VFDLYLTYRCQTKSKWRSKMRVSRIQAAENRQTVINVASRLFRERGFDGIGLKDLMEGAGLTQGAFYKQFESKEDCFMSALEAATDAVLAQAFATRPTGGTPLERFDSGLRTYLDALAAQPALSRLFLIEVYAAGPAALERRAAVQRRFAAVLDDTFGRRTAGDRFANEAIVAATSSMVTARLAADDLKGLRALRRPLVGLARRLHGE